MTAWTPPRSTRSYTVFASALRFYLRQGVCWNAAAICAAADLIDQGWSADYARRALRSFTATFFRDGPAVPRTNMHPNCRYI